MKPLYACLLAVLLVVLLAAPSYALRGARGGSVARTGGARASAVPRRAPTPAAGAHPVNAAANVGTHSILRSGPNSGTPGGPNRLGLADRDGLPQAAAHAWNAGHPQPFTPAWYANHPHAFHAAYLHADVVAAATAASLAAWLATPAAVVVNSSEVVGTVQVVTEVDAQSDASAVGAASVSEAATTVPSATDWLPLGVFALKSSESTQATRVARLFVDHAGNLRGSQVDVLSENVEEIQGRIDKETRTATWTIGAARTVSFEAPVRAFTESEHDVTVRFANGVAETWRLTRVTE